MSGFVADVFRATPARRDTFPSFPMFPTFHTADVRHGAVPAALCPRA
jgi:hypothetical protein